MRDIRIEEMEPSEVQYFAPVFQCIMDLHGDFSGFYFKLMIDGKEHLLHRIEDLFTVFTINNGNEVSYEMFCVDEDYKITSAGFDDFEMQLVSGDRCIQFRDTYNVESLVFIKRSDGHDIDGFDGSIGYIQYNQEHDVRLMLLYQQMYNSAEQVHGYQTGKEPFQILIEKGLNAKKKGSILPVRSERYIKTVIDSDDVAYGVSAIREYGLSEFLQKGAYNLHKEDRIIRYYKILTQTKEKYAITTYPLGTGYRLDAFDELFKKYGFKRTIPQELIQIHNNQHDDLNRYQDIADYMKEVELNPPSEVQTLTLKFGGEEENGEDS